VCVTQQAKAMQSTTTQCSWAGVGSVLGLAFGWLMLCSLRSGGPTTIPATGWPKPSAQWARGVASRALCHPHSQPVGAWVHCWGPGLVGNTQGAQQGGTESGPQGPFPGARLHRASTTTCGLAASPPWLGAKTGLSQGAHHQQGAMQNQLVWSYENTVVYVWLVSYELKQSSHGLFFKSSSNFYYIKWD